MAPVKRRVRRVVELAELVQADIRQRELKPGDRYLSTGETAKMFRVDTAVANRALQPLAKRKVVTRRQRAGTFIADGNHKTKSAMLHCVHLLMGDRHAQAEGWLDTDALLAIQSELPGVGLKLHVTPTSDEEQYVEQVIQDALRSQQPEGFVLMRSTLTTQRMIAASGLSAVLFGHPYASVKGLPFVDRDQYEIGRLLAEYVVGRGHRRIVMLMRDRLLPGDLEMIDGVREVLNAAGLPADSLVLRCVPHDIEEARIEVSQLLDGCDKLPGILIRSPLIADAAIEAIKSLGLVPQQDVAVGVADYFQSPPGGPPYAVIRPALEGDQQGARLGCVVAQLARGETIDPKHRLSPVVLQLPEGTACGVPVQPVPSVCDTRIDQEISP